MTPIAPFLVFLVGAILAALTAGRARAVVMLATPLVGALNLYALPVDAVVTTTLFGRELIVVDNDRLARLFGWLFLLAAFMGGLYSLSTKDRVQHVAIMAYTACTMGVVFAGDLATVFLFWEGMALTSAFLVLARRTDRSLRSTMRYLVIQVMSGMLMLAGIIALHQEGRSLALQPLGLDGLASWLIFLAIGIKAGFPLLHNWITDAYPEATETGTVMLAAFTTKVAILALARLFPGTEALIYIGAAMAVLPMFYALIENDLRRVLCYSLIIQLGFMVVGVGVGTELAINGAVAHAFTHVLYKSLLFMAMGAVLYRTGRIDASGLGGLYKAMPATTVLCIVGAASIAALPLFAGFVSKAMILSAVLYAGHDWVWLALLFASAGVLHYAGIRIPYYAFFAGDSGLRPREAPASMLAAMGLAAAGCILIGVWPGVLQGLLPYPIVYDPYTASHVLSQCQLLFFAALAFVWMQRTGIYPVPAPGTVIDAEWVYRRLLPRAVGCVRVALARTGLVGAFVATELRAAVVATAMRWHGPRGALARDPVGSYALIAIVALLAVVMVMELLLGAR